MILHQFLNPRLHMAAITGHSNGKITKSKLLNHLLTLEIRIISAGLIPLTVAPFAAGTLNPIPDAILCSTILIHSYIGFQYVYKIPRRLALLLTDSRSCIIDYIPSKRYPKARALFWWGLRAATLTVGVGLYEFETNDVGLTEAIKRIWTA